MNNRKPLFGLLVILSFISQWSYASDEEATCQLLWNHVDQAAQRSTVAQREVSQRADYLLRIAQMSRAALQSPYPSSAAVYQSEMTRASQNLDMAKMSLDAADSAFNATVATYAQACPLHFADIQAKIKIALAKISGNTESQTK
jgi:hypothetical protein